MIPLPVEVGRTPTRPSTGSGPDGGRTPATAAVVVLGFLFPDRGYEQVIAALPDGVESAGAGPTRRRPRGPARRAGRPAAAAGHRCGSPASSPDAELAGWLRSVGGAGRAQRPGRRLGLDRHLDRPRPAAVGPGLRRTAGSWPSGRPAQSPSTRQRAPGGLRAAIEAALAEPASTRIGDGVWLGPGLAEVAAGYARHFAGCRPAAPLRVGPGRWAVPDNRWDLLSELEPTEPPAVSVVVPYFEAQRQLDLVLAALAIQTHPVTRLEVVVADDGSASAAGPGGRRGAGRSGWSGSPTRASGRRRPATSAPPRPRGTCCCSWTGTPSPSPTTCGGWPGCPALAPDALVVGRRRHADLTGWDPTG